LAKDDLIFFAVLGFCTDMISLHCMQRISNASFWRLFENVW